jgi:hypothetical protein
VTLAFSQKHLLPSLRPPTSFHDQAPQRDEIRYRSGQQFIPDAKLRRNIRKVMQGRSLILQSDDEVDESHEEGENETQTSRTNKVGKDLLNQIELIPDVAAGLGRVDGSLVNVFNANFGVHVLLAGREPPAVYRRLFVQVRSFDS